MAHWTSEDIPDQTGRTALVTGANTGLGFETARMLARKGAKVVLACRDREKGGRALERIRREAPATDVSLLTLDLADLGSISTCALSFADDHQRLDLLINNAGVMVPPLSRTRQGFELQLGTNHLGHFALTGGLMPLLAKTRGSRVVVVSSAGALIGRIDFDDLQFERRRYRKWLAYGQSKLANLLFTRELARRLDAARSHVTVTAAHPGGAATDLQRNTWFFRTLVNPWVMRPADGALPTLRAAVDPSASNGSYWGPGGALGMRGPPVEVRLPRHATDRAVALRLWEESERLTGVRFPLDRDDQGAH